MVEMRKRSMVKAISFRIIATFVTMLLIYVITGSLSFAGIIGVLDVVTKLLIYYYHERIWEKLKWGKQSSDYYSENYFSEEL